MGIGVGCHGSLAAFLPGYTDAMRSQPVTAPQCKQVTEELLRHSLHCPVKSVSDPLKEKHAPCCSVDHGKGGVVRSPVLRLILERGRRSGEAGCTWQMAEFLIPVQCSRITSAPVMNRGLHIDIKK